MSDNYQSMIQPTNSWRLMSICHRNYSEALNEPPARKLVPAGQLTPNGRRHASRRAKVIAHQKTCLQSEADLVRSRVKLSRLTSLKLSLSVELPCNLPGAGSKNLSLTSSLKRTRAKKLRRSTSDIKERRREEGYWPALSRGVWSSSQRPLPRWTLRLGTGHTCIDPVPEVIKEVKWKVMLRSSTSVSCCTCILGNVTIR